MIQDEEQQRIAEQVKAIDEEIEVYTLSHSEGSISDKDYKLAVAKLKFQRAQVQERNAVTYEKEQQRAYERERDNFSD